MSTRTLHIDLPSRANSLGSLILVHQDAGPLLFALDVFSSFEAGLNTSPCPDDLWHEKAEARKAGGRFTLTGARAAERCRGLGKQGVHPAHERQLEAVKRQHEGANTFETVALEWLEQNAPHWTARITCCPPLRQDLVEALIGGVAPGRGNSGVGPASWATSSTEHVRDQLGDLRRVYAAIRLVARNDQCAVLAAPFRPRQNTVGPIPVEFRFPPGTVAGVHAASRNAPSRTLTGFHVLNREVGILRDAIDGERLFVTVLDAPVLQDGRR